MAPYPSPTSIWHSNTYPSLSPSRPELSVKGKTIVVTGGGSGIGAETARSFAQAGASRIALLGRRQQPLIDTKASIEQRHPDIEVFVASTDITKQREVQSAFSEFAGHGKIDILISNAAVTGPHESVRDVDDTQFLGSIDTNLRGALYLAQVFLRYASQDAVVIDVNSFIAHQDLNDGFAAYAIAKLGVFRLWDMVSTWNPNIRVFHIQPGVVVTDMNKEVGGADKVGHSDHVSLPATFMVWLASPEARFLKGKYLWSNWDVDELKARAEEIESSRQLTIGLVGWPFGDFSWKPTWDDGSSGAQ